MNVKRRFARTGSSIERWTNLWSRRIRRRVGRFPNARSLVRNSSPAVTIPDLISPYGWGIARRSGTIDLDQLRHLDPIRQPDQFRTTVQSRWGVIQDDESAVIDDLLLRCSQAVGTPILSKDAIVELLTCTEGWREESYRQWSTVIDRYRLEPFWAATGRTSVSITLATRRPENIDVWAPIVALQSYRPLQAVAALHGAHWSAADEFRIRSILEPSGIDVQTVRVDQSKELGEVLQAAASRSDGDVLIKWDDDDLYSTTHVVDLLRARHYSGAEVVGKAGDFYYLQGAHTTVRRVQAPHEIFSPTLAGSALTIGRDDLRAVGGWDPLPRREDAALVEKVRRAGGRSYRTVGFGLLVIRRADSAAHTWNPGDGVFLATGNPRRPGLDANWAMIDLPDEIIRRAVPHAGGER